MNGFLLFHIVALIIQAVMLGYFIKNSNIFGIVWCVIFVVYEVVMVMSRLNLIKGL